MEDYKVLFEFFKENFDEAPYWECASDEVNKRNINKIIRETSNNDYIKLAIKHNILDKNWINNLKEHLEEIIEDEH